jgi:predicted transcriptional regulator
MQTTKTPIFFDLKNLRLPYRNRLEVSYEVLRLCIEPRSQTRVMQVCNLSHPETKSQLKHLAEKGFLENCQGYYYTTKLGKQFLDGLEIILEMWHA